VHTSDSSGLLLTDNFVTKTEEIICIMKLKITSNLACGVPRTTFYDWKKVYDTWEFQANSLVIGYHENLYSNYAIPITMSTTKCVGYTPISIFLDFLNSI
jgi:hypothetical protein